MCLLQGACLFLEFSSHFVRILRNVFLPHATAYSSLPFYRIDLFMYVCMCVCPVCVRLNQSINITIILIKVEQHEHESDRVMLKRCSNLHTQVNPLATKRCANHLGYSRIQYSRPANNKY